MQVRDFEFRVLDSKERVLRYSGIMANFATYALLMDISSAHEIEIFTGYKDRKNQKIFEGDVVRIYINNAPGELWKVEFCSKRAAFVLCILGFKKLMSDFFNNPLWSCEVVGNIHEMDKQ